MEYIAYLHKDRGSDYGVSFPDFPGCITAGRTLDEAARMAAEALALHIQGMIEDGDTVPEPSKVDDIAADAAKRGAIAFLVSVEPPDATVRVNITARESQLAKIDALAAAAGLTRSGYMVRTAIGEATNKQKQARARVAQRVRSYFVKTKSRVTVYREQDEDYGEDQVAISSGETLHVATEGEVRKLKGKRVRVVLFTIGTAPGWYWMPEREFDLSTEIWDVKQQTGTPFAR